MLYKLAWVLFLMLVSFLCGIIFSLGLRLDVLKKWEESEVARLTERVQFQEEYILNGCRRVDK